VELTVNKGRAEPYSLGDGYGHMAFVVDDLAAEHARMKSTGLAPKDIKQMTHDGKPFGTFFFIEDPDGYKIEVLQSGGRFQ
jgi:lactoylglutathione lyase